MITIDSTINTSIIANDDTMATIEFAATTTTTTTNNNTIYVIYTARYTTVTIHTSDTDTDTATMKCFSWARLSI